MQTCSYIHAQMLRIHVPPTNKHFLHTYIHTYTHTHIHAHLCIGFLNLRPLHHAEVIYRREEWLGAPSSYPPAALYARRYSWRTNNHVVPVLIYVCMYVCLRVCVPMRHVYFFIVIIWLFFPRDMCHLFFKTFFFTTLFTEKTFFLKLSFKVEFIKKPSFYDFL